MNELPPWLQALSEEDLHFIRRFILASGSLKEVAGQYGISYPTVRLRLDRLIEKIKIFEDPANQTLFHRTLKMMVAEGKIEIADARTLVRAYDQAQKGEEP